MKPAVAFWSNDGYPYIVDLEKNVIQNMIERGDLVVRESENIMDVYLELVSKEVEEIESDGGFWMKRGDTGDWFLARVLDA